MLCSSNENILAHVMTILILTCIFSLSIQILGRRKTFGWIICFCMHLMIIALYSMEMMHAWSAFLLELTAFLVLWFLSKPDVKAVSAVNVKNPAQTPVKTISQGKLTGVYNAEKTVEVYAGIPYAKAPIGKLRWKAPQDPESWNGIRKCNHFAPMSMQETHSCIFNSLYQIIGYHDWKIDFHPSTQPVSEDSLYLNIWKPTGNVSDLPVLVFIHGGYLEHGQAWYPDYSGEGLAKTGRAVVVNMSYRLGIFGFLADTELQSETTDHSSGNYGLMDQIKALEWVKRNIHAFGGNPDNITIAGESSGSACVSALCTSPVAKGLFQKAVGESSAVVSLQPPHSFRPLEQVLLESEKLKQKLSCSISDLRNMPAEKLVKYSRYFHAITTDGMVLKEMPYQTYQKKNNNEIALLHGYNAREMDPFMLFERIGKKNYVSDLTKAFGREYADKIAEMYPVENDEEAGRNARRIYTAEFFGYSHYCWSRLAAENDIPVYEYYFVKKNKRLGDWHSGEEVYLYDNIPHSRQYDQSDHALAEKFSAYLLNFLETGNPNGQNLPEWNITDGNHLQLISNEIKEVAEQYQKLYALFDEMYQEVKMKSIF